MKHIGEYKDYRVFETELRHALVSPKIDTIYLVPSSSGYDVIYLGEKVGRFDSVYRVDWFSQEKADELYKRWIDAEIERAKEAAMRASTSTFTVEEKKSTDYWIKKIEDALATSPKQG